MLALLDRKSAVTVDHECEIQKCLKIDKMLANTSSPNPLTLLGYFSAVHFVTTENYEEVEEYVKQFAVDPRSNSDAFWD